MKKYTRYEMDMTSGNFFWKIFAFSIPLMLTGVLQLFYNAADLIIVSNFSNEKDAIGAVGSTSSLINLVVNLFMGLSVGTNVICARYFGYLVADIIHGGYARTRRQRINGWSI